MKKDEKKLNEEKSQLKKLNLTDAELLLAQEMDEVIGGDYDCYCARGAGQPG